MGKDEEMKIKVPGTIQIGGRVYQIKQVPDLGLREGSHGYRSSHELAIVVDSRLNDTMKAETFWHEMVEGINVCYCAKTIPHDTIEGFGNGLFQVMMGIGIELDWGG